LIGIKKYSLYGIGIMSELRWMRMRQCGCLELYYIIQYISWSLLSAVLLLVGRFLGIWMCDVDFVFDLIRLCAFWPTRPFLAFDEMMD